jgi:hypothetical protein
MVIQDLATILMTRLTDIEVFMDGVTLGGTTAGVTLGDITVGGIHIIQDIMVMDSTVQDGVTLGGMDGAILITLELPPVVGPLILAAITILLEIITMAQEILLAVVREEHAETIVLMAKI